ncbi:MAG: SAM hydrolase/SAM-dependent halogenase family protein [Candidatus Helarchaeota archaeon]
MTNKIITLLTDFGTSDPYVSIMKGVILSISPDVSIVDLSHEIPKFNIIKGALFLNNAGQYFPKNTIHVVVIDPGVGTKRLPILIKTRNYYLIGPDNGVLSLLAYNDRIEKIIKLENPKYFLKQISMTFHGRDIFAPISAHCANNVDIEEFGPEIQEIELLHESMYAEPLINSDDTITFYILDIDGFGNIITNIPQTFLLTHLKNMMSKGKINSINNIIFKISKGKSFESAQTLSNINFPFKNTYNEVKIGEFLALIGSHGNLEFSRNQDSAVQKLKLEVGTELTLKVIQK